MVMMTMKMMMKIMMVAMTIKVFMMITKKMILLCVRPFSYWGQPRYVSVFKAGEDMIFPPCFQRVEYLSRHNEVSEMMKARSVLPVFAQDVFSRGISSSC